MSVNPSVSQMIDSGQIVKRVYSSEHDAIRAELVGDASFNFSLDSKEDSVTSFSATLSVNTGPLTSSSSNVVIPATSCAGLKSFQLFGSGNVQGNIRVQMQFSPSDDAEVWVPGESVFLSSTDAIEGSDIRTILARRVRVVISRNDLKDGDIATFYLVGSN